MSIEMNSTCIACRVDRITAKVSTLGTEAQTTAFLKEWMKLAITYSPDVDSARCGYYTDNLIKEFYGVDPAESHIQDRRDSNQFVLERIDLIRNRIKSADDPLYAGLQYAILGNYLDFAALAGRVSYEEMDALLDKYKDFVLDKQVVADFASDLEKAENLLILTDNAGEIVFDRVLAELIQELYPDLKITFCVRGLPVANDATREDALAAQITFPVLDNGTALGGTDLETLPPETRQAFETADVILAKGMGNTESLFGCGYNVYYAFMVKCKRFEEFFGADFMQALFLRDKK
ncbi:MAG: DUF89 family protein [Oscillospiraceae bacterium]|nr:DUF89 family protein [Oscillospiraceae bacterium]